MTLAHGPNDDQPRTGETGIPGDQPCPDTQTWPVAGDLNDPLLALSADILDDAERTRIANENRLRQMLRGGPDDSRITSGKYTLETLPPDQDGEERGFGIPLSHPTAAKVHGLVELLRKIETDASLNLQRIMKQHPLGPWLEAQKGVGPKQAARLLASIGDPYIRPEILNEDDTTRHPGGPRTVSALWAYCGLHTLPASQTSSNNHKTCAGEKASSDLGQDENDAPTPLVQVAARRTRGQIMNWNPTAKSRTYLIAEKCMMQFSAACKLAGEHVHECSCSTYRLVYDRRKAATEGRLHKVECVRCGPSGKPAPIGSPWSDAHRHADALRITSKTFLRDLWREAKRLHETP